MKLDIKSEHIGNIEKHPLEANNPFSPAVQRKAFLNHCSLNNWNKPIAMTLSMRQSRTVSITLEQWKGLGNTSGHFCGTVRESLDYEKCSQNLRHFMNVINAKVCGKQRYWVHGKRLLLVPVIEKGWNKRWHYHAAIDCPKHFDSNDFQTLIREVWEKTYWGYHEVELVADSDYGWLNYMMKLRDKEHYDLSIEWLNYHNPL